MMITTLVLRYEIKRQIEAPEIEQERRPDFRGYLLSILVTLLIFLCFYLAFRRVHI